MMRLSRRIRRERRLRIEVVLAAVGEDVVVPEEGVVEVVDGEGVVEGDFRVVEGRFLGLELMNFWFWGLSVMQWQKTWCWMWALRRGEKLCTAGNMAFVDKNWQSTVTFHLHQHVSDLQGYLLCYLLCASPILLQ